jgi:hypothetical protein
MVWSQCWARNSLLGPAGKTQKSENRSLAVGWQRQEARSRRQDQAAAAALRLRAKLLLLLALCAAVQPECAAVYWSRDHTMGGST